MDAWEQLYALSSDQKRSVTRIEAALARKHVPDHFVAGDAASVHSTRPSSPSSATAGPDLFKRLQITTKRSSKQAQQLPIETRAQFHEWYTTCIEPAIESEQLVQHVDYLAQIESHVTACQDMLDAIQNMTGFLKELEANYKFVEENSRVLQLACEEMLDQQKHLLDVAKSITARLAYFRELEKATRQLNMPGESIVLDPDFLSLLDRLDVCLDFLKSNASIFVCSPRSSTHTTMATQRHFKDAEIYLIRFQQCLTRSMTLIKIYFVNLITSLTAESTPKLSGKHLSETAFEALTYTKFANRAENTRVLLNQVEKRALIDPDEYASLLYECHDTWFTSRNALVSEAVSEEIKRMDPYNSDLVQLARSGCSYLRTVCLAEWNLFGKYFSASGETQIYTYLESICDRLYDYLRPRILHESSLDKLCELVTVLQGLIALDTSVTAADDDDDDRGAPEQSLVHSEAHVTLPPLKSLNFSKLLVIVLQDAQTRLVFRAQSIIQSEVLHYVPTDEDFDYPAKLLQSKRMSLWINEHQNDPNYASRPLAERLPDEHIQRGWYPTLARTLWVLSKLHTYVNDGIFEDFAGEAVTLCRQSLQAAAQRLSQLQSQKSVDANDRGPLQAQLFTIRHLLILKDMVASVDLIQVDRAANFSNMTDALSNLLWHTSTLFNPSALFSMASHSMPNFSETMVDAKKDLDQSLKAVCEDFIVQSGVLIAAPLRSFLTRAGTVPTDTLSSQEWALPDHVIQLHQSFVAEQSGALEVGINELLERLKLWISDRQAVAVLVAPIFEEVLDTYTDFFNLVKSEYDFAVSSQLLSPASVRECVDKKTQGLAKAAPGLKKG